MTPQLVVIGHIVKDVHPDGWTPGGGALYAAAQAAKLGTETSVLTACDADISPATLISGVSWQVVGLDACTEFKNTYTKGKREQQVRPNPRALTVSDIPHSWRDAPSILLTPVFHDIEPDVPAELVKQGARVAIGAQGWLRGRDGDRVLPGVVDAAPEWLAGDVVFLSVEDVENPEAVEQWQERVPVVVLTRGDAGYTVWDARGRHDIPPLSACERDPTGAGDVFATSYLVRHGETGDVLASTRFAAAAAALSVEGAGIASVPDRAQIEARLDAAGVSG